MKNLTFLKFLTVGLLLLNANIFNAQITKGTFRLGPHVEYSSGSSEIDGLDIEIKNSDLEIGLSAGYFFIDNLEAGLSVSYLSQKDEIDNFESSTSGIFLGPHIEYNVSLSPQFYLPIGGGLGYNSLTTEDDSGDETSLNGISYGLWTGIEFIANNKLSAELLIGPQFGTLKDADSDSEFDITTISARIGVHFYF